MYSDWINKLEEYLDSEEGKADTQRYVQKLKNENNIFNSQLERFHKKYSNIEDFEIILDKIINKYSSDKYRDRHYNKGCEPPESLFYFLLNYFEKYGRLGNGEEIIKYNYPNSIFYLNGYYCMLFVGQGSFISIEKENI